MAVKGWMGWNEPVSATPTISTGVILEGKIFTEIYDNGDELVFKNANEEFHLAHQQDCCESVSLEEVIGDLSDLINTPILRAEEVDSGGEGPQNDYVESYTWTFYKLATIKGEVVLRWYGESNGYYSESVDLYQTRGDDDDHNND
jgi:hypothetical protein